MLLIKYLTHLLGKKRVSSNDARGFFIPEKGIYPEIRKFITGTITLDNRDKFICADWVDLFRNGFSTHDNPFFADSFAGKKENFTPLKYILDNGNNILGVFKQYFETVDSNGKKTSYLLGKPVLYIHKPFMLSSGEIFLPKGIYGVFHPTSDSLELVPVGMYIPYFMSILAPGSIYFEELVPARHLGSLVPDAQKTIFGKYADNIRILGPEDITQN